MTRPQSIRRETLFQLFAAGINISLSPARISKDAKHQDYDYTETEILQACLFWKDQKFVEEIPDPAGEKRFRITAAGIVHYENNYAA